MSLPHAVLCCPTCATPARGAGVVSCTTCGTRFIMPGEGPRPFEPSDLGSAGFELLQMAGYTTTPDGGRLVVRGAGTGTNYLAQSRAQHADVVAAATVTFLEGPVRAVQAGLVLRRRKPGRQLAAFVSADGTFSVVRFELGGPHDGTLHHIVPWGPHPALRQGLDVPNSLEVQARGDAWKVLLNGEVAATFTEASVPGPGHVRVAYGANGAPLAIALSALSLA